MSNKNDYSSNWFDIFLNTYPVEYTLAEANFIQSFLPQEQYKSILDICCGSGRHATLLAKNGYEVTGIDINADVIAKAKKNNPHAVDYRVHDMRHIEQLAQQFDAVINMWQSFGYFDAPANKGVLKAIHAKLVNNGRFIIDIYNRDFFEQNTGEKNFERAGQNITERKSLDGNRLIVELDYGDTQNADIFSWQLFSLEEFTTLAKDCGFETLASCTHANIDIAPSEKFPRMQAVLQKL